MSRLPEMEAFSQRFGFTWRAHEIQDLCQADVEAFVGRHLAQRRRRRCSASSISRRSPCRRS